MSRARGSGRALSDGRLLVRRWWSARYGLRADPGLVAWRLYRDREADAPRGQQVSPVDDHLPVGLADRADLAVQVEEAHGIDRPAVLAQGHVPVHLVRDGVPGEAD